MTQDAIGLILSLAQRGEVDPWDIDVVQLTDRFLSSLGELRTGDLGVMGQALFYASVLIHLKAQHLEAQTFPVLVEENFILEEEDALLPGLFLPLPLERAIKRRLSAPQLLPERPLTLQDLLTHLKEAEHLEKKILPLPLQRLRGNLVRNMEQVKDLAHHENLEELIQSVQTRITRHFAQTGAVLVQTLIEEAKDGLGTFLALLFLSARALVDLEQQDFYGEIWVKPGAQWGI